MFESPKKIRRINQALDAKQKNQQVQELVDAVVANKPEQADKSYQQNLKYKLLEKYKHMKKHSSEKVENSEKKFSLWADWRIKGLAFALGLLALVVIGGIASYPLLPAPTVQGYVLKNSIREFSLNAPIKVTFSQLMDTSSVEKAFSIEPALPGKFSWSGNTLNYKPDQALKLGDVYKVTVNKSAVSFLRKPLPSDYEENFKIVKAPEITFFTPNDKSTEIAADSKITMMFDRPMTEFSTLEQGEQNIPTIRIEPAVTGKYKWLGTAALQFIPDKLNLATTYKVTVPAGVMALDGGSSEKDFVASFDTVKPISQTITSTDGGDSSNFSTKSKIKISFNQKVDLASAQQLITLTDDKNNVVPVGIRYFNLQDYKNEQARSGERIEMNNLETVKTEVTADAQKVAAPAPVVVMPKTEDLETSLMMEPTDLLKSGMAYSVDVKAGVKGNEGPLATAADAPYTFKVLDQFKFMNGSQGDANANGYDNFNSPLISFNAPLDLRSFKNKIHISPPNKDADGKEVEVTPNLYADQSLSVGYEYKPSTKYKISVDAGVKDIYGDSYDQPIAYEFTTPALLSDIYLESGTDVTVVDGTKPSIFYVKSVNISDAKVFLKKLSQEDFNKFYGNGYVDYSSVNYGDADFEQKNVLPIKLAFNKRGHTKLDLDAMFGQKLQPGFYYLRVNNPQAVDANGQIKQQNQLMIVSKSALALKSSANQMMVWATDLAEGKPVEGMKLKIVDRTGEINLTATTDANGIAKVDIPKTKSGDYYRDFSVIGDKDGDLSFANTTWSEGIAAWNFNINSESYSPSYYSYIYTDRPIYRPTQEVLFKGILRKDSDRGFKLPDIKKVKVEITDTNGNSIFDKEMDLNANGTFNGSVQLGENITTGDYSLKATLLGAEGPDWANQFYANFKVVEYRKPEYKLDITPEKKDYINGETAKVTVNAGYYFGAPLPNTDVTWTVKASDYYFILPEDLAAKLNGDWFSFAQDGFFCYWGCQGGSEIVSQGTGKTDAQGNYQINLPLQIGDKKMSQIYTLEASISDANHQSVSNRVTFPVHKGEVYVGVRSSDYVIDAGKPAKFEVLTVSPAGEIVKGANVEVALYKRDWNTIKRQNVDSGYYYENSYDDKLVEKKNTTSGDNGLGEVEFTIKDGGSYKVEATMKDSHGNEIKSSTTIYAGSSEFVNWGSENNDRIELVTDKTEYKVGDTAKVLIKSPYRGVNALVTYEKENVFQQKVIKLDSNSQTFEVPITEKFLPNAFVSVLIMKGNKYDAGLQQPADGAGDERQIAAFKVGYATLQVNTADKKLNIDIKSDKKVYGPKEKVKLTLHAADFAGKGVPAELSVGVVDESVLSLTDSVTADLLNVFYRQRMLGVTLAETLTKAISRVNVQVEAGLKGGGGGGIAKRGLFKDTAYFEAVVKTDANGDGTVEFTLPDNLTTWQVMAIGITEDKAGAERTLVGSNKYSFLVTKDVLVRPVLPRFLTAGDNMTVSAIVNNYTETDQNVNVQLTAQGVDLQDSASKNVTVKSKSSETVNWKIKVADGLSSGDSAKLDFKAVASNNDQVGDDVEQTLKIHQASFPSFVSTSKVINDDVKQVDKVWLPNGLDKKFGKLTISVSATLAGTINQGLEYLMTYPYGCSEQLASSILPNLALKHLIDLGKFDTKGIDQTQLRKNVESGLQSIYKNQKPDGGFGLWAESDPNEIVTAYVVSAFNEAEKAGYDVDKNVKNMGIDYLVKSIKKLSIKGSTDDLTRYYANERAYVLFVLNEIGQGDLGLMNNLDESRNLLSLDSKAYLVMAYQGLIDQNKAGAAKAAVEDKVNSLKKELENAAQQTPKGVSFANSDIDYRLFETDTKTTALVMKALNRIDSNHPLIPKILESLLKEKQAGHYETTQETAVTLMALIEYLEKSKELSPAYEGLINVDGKEVVKQNYTSKNVFETINKEVSLSDLLGDNLDNEVTAQKTGNGKMYVDMNLEYYLPLAEVKARNEGMEVTQEYFAQDDVKEEHPLTEVKVGQNLKGKMTIVVPEDRNYVMVEDFLPAGLEGIDFNLNTSQQNLDNSDANACSDGSEEGCMNKDWYFTHSEVRDDRMMYFADYLPKGVYEINYYVRSTSVGNFADLPAMAQETYFPEVFGRSSGKMFKVNE